MKMSMRTQVFMDIFCDKGTIKRKKPTLVKDDLNMIVPRLVNFHNIRSAFLLTSFGAEDEARTRDPNLGKVVLYQLSYFRRFFCLKRVVFVWDCKGTQKIFTSKSFCKKMHKKCKKSQKRPKIA